MLKVITGIRVLLFDLFFGRIGSGLSETPSHANFTSHLLDIYTYPRRDVSYFYKIQTLSKNYAN
jgi:hypothetical protein